MKTRCAGVVMGLASVLAAGQPVRAKRAMVATGESSATDAGVAVLKSGGSAMDAAVAIGFALGVTHSGMGGLGGGGYLLARFADGRTAFVDFREKAPGKSSRDMFLDAAGAMSADSRVGWRAAGVPGTVRGLEYAHKKWGRKAWAELLEPAIGLAEKGSPVNWGRAEGLRSAKALAADPESKRIFLNGGAMHEPGSTLVQPELAATLRRIARHGAADFYSGETARRLAAQMAAHGGLV
ncbi:MAG: gamma-glutamyltransferase, partial [Bryobacteraceae bacterium]